MSTRFWLVIALSFAGCVDVLGGTIPLLT